MPVVNIELTDTFDQWRQKDNTLIGVVNTLTSTADIVSVNGPQTGQLLVYNGTAFENVTLSGDATLASDGTITVTGGADTLTKGRIRFAGSMTNLY
jgi:hypothetical protein